MVNYVKYSAEDPVRVIHRFLHVPKAVLPAIQKVFEEARGRLYYDVNPFPRVDMSRATVQVGEQASESIDIPKGPGGVVGINYKFLLGVSNKNQVENMMRRIISDGFDMMLPEESLRAYMQYELSRPAFERHVDVAEAHFQTTDTQILNRFEAFMDSLMTMAEDQPLPVRREPEDKRQMLDRNATEGNNIHTRNILTTYEFLNANPKYAVALFMWTHSMREYCRDLSNYVSLMSDVDQALFVDAPFWDTIKLITGDNKLINTKGFNGFLDVTPIISVVMGGLLEKAGIDFENAGSSTLNFEDLKPALDDLSVCGVFQEVKGETAMGNAFLRRCPVSRKLGEWLSLDLGREGKPEDSVFAKFVERVEQEIKNPTSVEVVKLNRYAESYFAQKLAQFETRSVRESLLQAKRCPFNHDQ